MRFSCRLCLIYTGAPDRSQIMNDNDTRTGRLARKNLKRNNPNRKLGSRQGRLTAPWSGSLRDSLNALLVGRWPSGFAVRLGGLGHPQP